MLFKHWLRRIKRLLGFKIAADDEADAEAQGTLRAKALGRARDLQPPRAGTPHDWEEWERYQREQEHHDPKKPDPKKPDSEAPK